MHIAPARPLAGSGVAAAVGAPAAAVGDRRELLDVDMHQLTRLFSLIAQRLGRRAAAAVAVVEAAQSRLHADAVHRRGVHAAHMGDEPRAAAGAAAQLDHPLSLRLGGAPRAVTGPAAAVPHARFALAAVAVEPLACCLVVDLEPLRRRGHAPAVLDEADHLEALGRGEGRVGMLGPSSLCHVFSWGR